MSKVLRLHFARRGATVWLGIALTLSACAAPATPEPPTATPVPPTATPPPPTATLTPTPAPFTLTSTAFEANQPIPLQYSCEGDNISPPLAWSGVPAGTASLALVMDDPDAVAVVGKVYDHWLLYNLPADLTALAEAMPSKTTFADGSAHGRNSTRLRGYTGPCPPAGPAHNYVFRLYALDIKLPLESGATKDELLAAMEGHILAQAELIGTFAAP